MRRLYILPQGRIWERRFWWGRDYGQDYPDVMFWLITVGFFLTYANAIQTTIEHFSVLMTSSRSFLILFGSVMVLAPASWIAFLGLHKDLKRLHGQLDGLPEGQALFKRVQGAAIAFVVGAYIILGFCLKLIRQSIQGLSP